MSFDSLQHPRATDGTFTNKVGSEAEVSLDSDAIEANGTETSISFRTPDGNEVEFEHGAAMFAEHITPSVFPRDDGDYDVYYASYNDDPSPYEFIGNDKLEGFSSSYERDAFVESQLSNGVAPENIFIVERFEHGSTRYSPLANWAEWSADERSESQRVSDRWDSAPSHVYIAGETEHPREQAKSVLDDYTAWANGENYAVHRATVTADGETLDSEAVYGFVGSESAEEAVRGADI